MSSSPPDQSVTLSIVSRDKEAQRLSSTSANPTSPGAIDQKSTDTTLASVADDQVWSNHPANPYNWSLLDKWKQAAVISAYTFVAPLASSMLAPGLPDIAAHYNITNSTLIALPISIFLLAFTTGPLIVSPLSEMYGRRWISHFSNVFFLIFNLLCAWAPNTTSFIVFRFLAGLGGATPIAIGGSVVSDVFPTRERAAAMAVFSMGPLLGPVIGPIAGGFVAETIGFKWVFISITCFAAIASIAGILILRETYHPILRAQIIRLVEEDADAAEKMATQGYHGLTKAQILWLNLSRPMVLLCTNFVLFILSLFMAIQYGFLYLMFTTFPELFPDIYGFSAGITGLCYLGLGVGFFGATILGATLANSIYIALSDRNGGVGKPEFRIPTMLIGSVLCPIGLLWFGWSAQKHVHYIMPIIGSGIFGASLMLTFLPIQLYLVDAFRFAASALAAASVFRSLFGFCFPLFANQMFEALTIGGGYSFLAGIAILVGCPFPLWIYFYGEKMRERK